MTHGIIPDDARNVCPVIGAFVRAWSSELPDDERAALIDPLISKISDTLGSEDVEHRRAIMTVDWLMRTHAPALLRLAHMDAQAAALESSPRIEDMIQCISVIEILDRNTTNAAPAAQEFLWANTEWNALWDAVLAASCTAYWSQAYLAIFREMYLAAWKSSMCAVWDATVAGHDLRPVRAQIQQSALNLVRWMIETRDA